jgi:hypothetical protein
MTAVAGGGSGDVVSGSDFELRGVHAAKAAANSKIVITRIGQSPVSLDN